MSALIIVLLLLSSIQAQNCGPKYQSQVCDAEKCCSQYGWCDTGEAYCDPTTCLKTFSGRGSPCATDTTLTTSLVAPTPRAPDASEIPIIDVCGNTQNGVSCPGTGNLNYFYRCCSSAGHCGPKNDIQDQSIYCGAGCQAGYGKCDSMSMPPEPTAAPGIAAEGETCGPIVNKRCRDKLCCSGSNFCGTGIDYCGTANWCQAKWGSCS